MNLEDHPIADDICEDCVIPASALPDLSLCVRCPFCKQVVNAIMTETHISCPACLVSVERTINV